MEYYFNIQNNISTNLLKENLRKYLLNYSFYNQIKLENNEFITFCFKQIDKITKNQNVSFEKYLSNYNISKLNNDSKLYGLIYSYPNILNDLLLFLSDNINNKNNSKFFISGYFNIIGELIKKISLNIINSSNDYLDSFESLFLSRILDILYNYYINKKSVLSNNIIVEEESYIPHHVEETMKNLIENNLLNVYFPDDSLKDQNFISRDQIMPKSISLLIQYLFKYFDICLILFLKENKNEYFEYWIKSKNKLFKFYCNCKILLLEKDYKGKYYKEIYALIFYLICFESKEIINKKIKQLNETTINNYSNQIDYLKKIYSSKSVDKFIELFNLLTENNIKNIIKSFENITNKDIKTSDIFFNEFITYLKGKEEMKDLLSFCLSNEGNGIEKIFDYIKIRVSLLKKLMKDLIFKNSLKYENILQNIIAKNIIYLDSDLRIQYFYTLLLNIDYQNDPNNQKYITLDRFKANKFKEKYNETKNPDYLLNETIFGQLFHNYENSSGKEFLLDQKNRLFKVELKGEKAEDAGGPYQEIISIICNELQSDYIDLFIKTPNNRTDSGELRDKYIANPDAKSSNYRKAYEFIGKLIGLAISTGDSLNLNFHPIVWKSILEYRIYFEEYETIDINFYNLIKNLEKSLKNSNQEILEGLYFTIKNSNKSDVELIENGKETKVTNENLEVYLTLAKSAMVNEIKTQIDHIKIGLYSVIDKCIIQLLDWKQLEEIVCGKTEFNIKEFKENTKYQYDNNNNKNTKIKAWFWEWFENTSEENKFKYLKFVSGRSRLPNSKFSKYEHIINIINKSESLPTAHTCFFSLDLPNYDTKEKFIEKIEYAILSEDYGNY